VRDKALRRLLGQLLQKNPDNRPDSWNDIIAILKAGGDRALERLFKSAQDNIVGEVHGISDRNTDAESAVAAGVAADDERIRDRPRGPDTGTGQSFDDQPEGKDLLGVSRLAKAIVDIHCRARGDAQVPSNVALYAEWGGGKSFARGN
jgi:hypothetical protein